MRPDLFSSAIAVHYFNCLDSKIDSSQVCQHQEEPEESTATVIDVAIIVKLDRRVLDRITSAKPDPSR
jgi:hypothetical protein